MIVDAHQHYWIYKPEEFEWIDESLVPLMRDFLPDELIHGSVPSRDFAAIAVQARRSLEENSWLLGLSKAHPFIAGVVGWVPLSNPSLPMILDQLILESRICGVREVLQGLPPGSFDDGRFDNGLREVASRGIPFDLLIFPSQIQEAIRLVDRHPTLTFVLDHLAKPPLAVGGLEVWEADLRDLARRPHVVSKLSGLLNELPVGCVNDHVIRRCFDVAFDAFGPSRLLFGSDWPVCTARGSYQEWLGRVRGWLDELSHSDQAAILGHNATHIYQLSEGLEQINTRCVTADKKPLNADVPPHH
jgi:L-fuconolactonase